MRQQQQDHEHGGIVLATPTGAPAVEAAETDVQQRLEQRSAWDVFRYYTSLEDRATYEAAYLGAWASRSAFGDNLLEEFGAADRLRRLPGWLQRYVQVVPERIVQDFEAAGYYYVADGVSGVYVFDRQVSGFPRPVAGLPAIVHNEEQ